jgi:hypothetical protein
LTEASIWILVLGIFLQAFGKAVDFIKVYIFGDNFYLFTMEIQIREVKSKADFDQFIYLPARIHRNHMNWMPNLYSDDRFFFDPLKNPSFAHSETFLALAWKGGTPVGRIMGIICNAYNEKHGVRDGRFFGLETYYDTEVHHELISYAENWARSKGCNRMIGPYGFSDKDPQGFLIVGYEQAPMIVSACNFPYQVTLLEKEGYTKEVDCVTMWYDLNTPIPAIYERVTERYKNREGVELIEFTKKKELWDYIVPVFTLMNETFVEIYGFEPMTKDEMYAFGKRYMPILDPRFIKIIKYKGEMTAFMLGMPCLTTGIQRAKGKMFPTGFYHILYASRTTKKLDLMLGGVKNKYRGMGFEVPMTLSLLKSAKGANYSNIEVHLILETNRLNLAEMERAGARPNKRFRVYQKPL